MSGAADTAPSTPPGAPDYSLVVPAYNEERLLGATLAALKTAMAAVPLAGEIVVCDNNSTDATAAVAAAAGARVVFEAKNQIARARNAGAAAARGRFLVFVDADTVVPPALLAAAIAAMASGRAAGGGSIMEMEIVVRNRFLEWLVRCWNAISARLRLAAGGFIFARRDAFDAAGGFARELYAAEELRFSRAVRRWGKERGLGFVILDGHPARTSGRKAEWYPAPLLFVGTLLLLVCPFLLRSRAFCWIWYRRPPEKRRG
jgi:glycosyltransferase involved in cell wall biosynthesis